jgi:DNA ligase-1
MLNENDSRLHKEEVLRKALSAVNLGSVTTENFLNLLSITYNPFITFGIKQVPESTQSDDPDNPWDEFNKLLSNLSNRELTGNAARQAVESMMRRFSVDEWNHLCRSVLTKDLRAGISDKTINKVLKGTKYEIPVFGCQLATSCENRPEMRSIKRLEPKLDGVRVLMTVYFNDNGFSVVSFSRNGKVFNNFGHIEKQIQESTADIIRAIGNRIVDGVGIVFDGEITGNSFQELMKQARRKENVQADDSVFHIFDVIPLDDFRRGHWNAPLKKRIEMLDKIRPVIDTMPNVKLLQNLVVDLDTAEGKDQLDRYARDMVELGYEGIMIKDLDAPYECKRNTFWLKWKPTLTVDLEVIDVEAGTGKNTGKLGALVCAGYEDGKYIRVNVGSGFDDDLRDSLWCDRDLVVGRTVEILCDVITQNMDGTHSLRFPRFVRFRFDK